MNYRLSYYFKRPHRFVEEIYDKIKWFIQRGKRGYSDYDTWSFDVYIVGVLAGGLKHLSKHAAGFPGNDEFPTWESWSDKLKEVAEVLEKYDKIFDIMDLKEEEKIYNDTQEALKWVAENVGALWD